MSSIHNEIVRVVTQHPNSRSTEDIQKLLPWFKKKSEVFRDLKQDVMSDIIRNCEFITRKRDSVVIKQGDKGDCFFIILSGKISIYINTAKDDEDDPEEPQSSLEPWGLPSKSGSAQNLNTQSEEKNQEQAADQSLSPKITALTKLKRSIQKSELFPKLPERKGTLETVLETLRMPSYTPGNSLDRSAFGQFIVSLEDGKSFGELALIRKDCIRNASIITDTVTQLLVVNRQLYNRCIRQSHEREFREKSNFVHESEYFQGWNARHKRMLSMSLRKVTYAYGATLVCQGQPVSDVFFLLSGQARVIIDPVQHKHQFPELYLRERKEKILSKPKDDSSEEQYSNSKRRRKSNPVIGLDICLIGINNMIGDVEVVSQLPTYLQSVVCEQQTVALLLDMRNYDRLIGRKHAATTANLLLLNASLKLENRALRFQQIPLLRKIYIRLCSKMPRHKNERWKSEDALHRVTPASSYGPLANLFGPGTVFDYIRSKSKQLQKAKTAPHKRKVQSSQESKTDIQTNPSNSDAIESEKSKNADCDLKLSVLQRLHDIEEKKMNQLEERILAWHLDVEETKLKTKQFSGVLSSAPQLAATLQAP